MAIFGQTSTTGGARSVVDRVEGIVGQAISKVLGCE